MTDGPSEKQIAVLKKNNREIPATKAEATAVIGTIFGNNKPATAEPEEKREEDIKSSKEEIYMDAVNAITIYASVCKSIEYPKELWNLSTVWNTERMRRK